MELVKTELTTMNDIKIKLKGILQSPKTLVKRHLNYHSNSDHSLITLLETIKLKQSQGCF